MFLVEFGGGGAGLYLEHLVEVLAADATLVGNGLDAPVVVLQH